MRRTESLMSRYPILWWIVVLVFVFTIGPSLLRATANVLGNPFGCPAGYSSDGDRLEPRCVPDIPPGLAERVDWPAVQAAFHEGMQDFER